MKKANLFMFSLLTVVPCLTASTILNKKDNNYKKIVEKTTETIQRFYGKDEHFKYYKIINSNLLYIQYSNFYAIVDGSDFTIIEIKKGFHNFNEQVEYNFLLDKENQNSNVSITTRSKKHFSPLENDKLDKLPNITNKIKDSWWWASRNTKKKVGYTDQELLSDKYDDSGLCEYIAISNILLYNELFKHSGIFNEEEFKNYFEYEKNNNSIINSSPTFKYYQYNHPDNSLVAKLWRLNKRWLNFYSYNSYTYPINKFLNNKKIFSKYEYDYKQGAYYYLTTKNILNDNPVIVSTAKTMHAFIIYGYDSKTQMLLLNWLWGSDDSIVLVNYWKLASSASPLKLIFTIKPKINQNLETKKLFKYKDKMYNAEEIRRLLNED